MKQAVPGVGSGIGGVLSRRRFVQAGLAGALLPAFGLAAGEASVLAYGMNYGGARIMRRVDPQGMPDFRPDAFGPMTFFVFPVGVAATPFDLYIADAGLSALFRYDPPLDAMMVVPGVRVTQQTRIAAVHDGSVVVVDRHQGPPRRFSRNGRLLQTIDPQNTGSRFDEFAVDFATGRYLGLDRVQRRIEEVHPLGRSASILAENLLPGLPGAMAVDDQTLYAAGQDCDCIVAVDLLRRDRHVLAEGITQATAMAAGEGWLVVADNVERVLRVYRNQILRGDPAYESLHLVNPHSLSIHRGTLYVADPGARRVVSFRLRA
jgi:hypothetical protein